MREKKNARRVRKGVNKWVRIYLGLIDPNMLLQMLNNICIFNKPVLKNAARIQSTLMRFRFAAPVD